MQLRPYQIKGQKDIWEGWSETDVLMFVLATGGGKTVTFVDVAKQFLGMGKSVWMIAHREELIDQAWATFYENRIFAGIMKGGVKPNPDLRTQIASIQTISRRDLSKIKSPDLIIIDEGHHTTKDNTYGKVLNSFPEAKVLIVTATPFRLNGEGFKQLVRGKETKLILNKTLYELQEDGYLVPFRFFVCSVPDMSGVHVRGGDYVDEEAEEAMRLAPLVQSYQQNANGLSCVVYAVNRHHSASIVDQYRASGISCESVDGETKAHDRADIFDRFRRKQIMVLVNVGIATEGTDIPGIEAIQLARPTKSLSLVMQMIGRASRALKGVVDDPSLDTPEKRKAAIAASPKKDAIILDNAGVLIEHYQVLQGEIDWTRYFNGIKKRSKAEITEEIEIIIFEYEDGEGRRRKTKNPKEIEGMQLIEVTKENRQKVVNIKSLKEFDKYVAVSKRLPNVKKKGWFAVNQYIDYCKKNHFEINDACWDYIKEVLVDNVNKRVLDYEAKVTERDGPSALLSPDFSIACAKMRECSLTKGQLKFIRGQYEEKNLRPKSA